MSISAAEQRENGYQDRRAHPRVETVVSLEISVDGSDVSASGMTIDLSLGGALAEVDQLLEVGEHCTIRFPKLGAEENTVVSATIVRAQSMDSGNLIAVHFDWPLPETTGLL
jgi:hypothetical protein